jgi:hypothetical protein
MYFGFEYENTQIIERVFRSNTKKPAKMAIVLAILFDFLPMS